MPTFRVTIQNHEWVEHIKDQTINYELADGHLADYLNKAFPSAEVEMISGYRNTERLNREYLRKHKEITN